MRLIDADALIVMEFEGIRFVPAEFIEDAEVIEERKRGEWIEENRRPKSMMFYCSECHRTAYDPQNHRGGRKRCRYAYCPNCGAEMRKGEAND